MLTEFSLDEDFFTSRLMNDTAVSLIHDYITKEWMERGAAILPKNGSIEIIKYIKKLPPKFHQQWLHALEYGKKAESEQAAWILSNFSNFASACELNTLFKTAFVEDTVGYILSENEDYHRRCSKTGFEVLSAGVSSASENFANSRIFASSDISAEGTIDEMWRDKFETTVKHSKKILIVDRYFFQGIHNDATRQIKNECATNFFKLLAKQEKQFNVKIISYGDLKDSDLHATIHHFFYSKIHKVAALRKNISSLTLVSANIEFFQKESHDRFIGFDKHLYQIGNGMRVFGKRPTPRATFSAKYDHNGELSTRETASRKHKLWSEEL